MRSEKVVQLLEGPEEILDLGNHKHKEVKPDRSNVVRELRSLERKLRYLYEERHVNEADAHYVYGKEKLECTGAVNWFNFV